MRHLLGTGERSGRAASGIRRRNVLAALLACGCNLGPERMAAATPGISAHEIAEAADWLLTEDALKAAVIDLVNHASRLPLSQLWGLGGTASADGMRFHVPANLLSADYSPLLNGRGVTLMSSQPGIVAGLLVGTVLGVALFRGVPVGPLIAAGLVSLFLAKS